eukprot:250581-Prymnesium_polylepis.2
MAFARCLVGCAFRSLAALLFCIRQTPRAQNAAPYPPRRRLTGLEARWLTSAPRTTGAGLPAATVAHPPRRKFDPACHYGSPKVLLLLHPRFDSAFVGCEKTLPRMQAVRDAGHLRRVEIDLFSSFSGEGIVNAILLISHRWDEPGMPDKDGTQLKEIKQHLRANPELTLAWYDYSAWHRRSN